MKKFQKLLLATAIASACQTAIAADAYDIIDLTAITQNDLSPALANDINNSGTVVGYLNGDYIDLLDENGDPVTNDSGNVIQYLEFIKGYSTDGAALTVFEAFEDTNQTTQVSSVNAINNAGISVGYSNLEYDFESTDSNGDPVSEIREQRRAVWFDQLGALSTVPELDPDANLGMQAYSVSDSGVIVGIGAYDRPNDVDENGDSVTSTSTNGFVFDINSESLTIVEPISLLEQADLELKDVNDAGLAIGWSSIEVEDSLITKAIYLDINNPTQINSIDPFVEGVSEAVAVNNDGVMVGSALHQDERYFTAFAYNTNDNSAIDLGSLNPGFIETALGFRIFNISKAEDVNSLGGGDFQVVGSSVVAYRQAAIYHAFLYENGEMKDLNELIDCPAGATERDWVLAEATAINDQGVIIGNGVNNGEYKSFMLVPKAAGATPVACVEEEEEDSGSGSFPIFAFLLLPLALIRKKLFV